MTAGVACGSTTVNMGCDNDAVHVINSGHP